MNDVGADRNLLLGILALQLDFIQRDQLIAAMHRWVLEKQSPLGGILVDAGDLSTERLQLLEALVVEHLRQHQDDPEKSLASLNSIGSVRAELAKLSDPQVDASLEKVPEGADTYGTLPPAAESLTSAEQRFRVLRPHASGGLAHVFVARDEEVHREVALKELQQSFADDPRSRARFLLEAEITGGLEHPGIVPIYGLGQYADGRPFYAMRFVRGDNLKEAIQRYHETEAAGRIPTSSSLELRKLLGRFVDVCLAVEYAHSRGVLHRDLKPGNIMLGDYGETLVVDWGLAKSGASVEKQQTSEKPLHPVTISDSASTLPGSTVGTPAYMSPEQASGRVDELGPSSDVYSLGATLYCLLTGRAPIVESNMTEAVSKARRGDFPAPRSVKAGVPAALEAICVKAMAFKPANRYQSPAKLADDVERWLGDEPVTAHREPFMTRSARWARRHKAMVASGLVLLGCAVIGLSIGTVLLNQANQRLEQQRALTEKHANDTVEQRDRASASAEEATRQRDIAQQATADAYLGRGLASLDQGRYMEGLHWLAHSLQAAPQPAVDAQRVSRLNLGVWRQTFLPALPDTPVERVIMVAESKKRIPYGLQLIPKLGEDFQPPPEAADPADVGLAQLYELENKSIIRAFDRDTLELLEPTIQPDGDWIWMDFDERSQTVLTFELEGEQYYKDSFMSQPAAPPDDVQQLFEETSYDGRVFRGVMTVRRRRLSDLADKPQEHQIRGTFVQRSYSSDMLEPSFDIHTGSDLILYYDVLAKSASVYSWYKKGRIGQPVPCEFACLGPDGLYWAYTDDDNTIVVVDGSTGQPVGKPLEHERKVTTAALGSYSRQLASATEDGVVHVWSVKDAAKLAEIRPGLPKVQSLTLSSGYRCVCVVATSGSEYQTPEIQLWHFPSADSTPNRIAGSPTTSSPKLIQSDRYYDPNLRIWFSDRSPWLLLSGLDYLAIWNADSGPSKRVVFANAKIGSRSTHDSAVFDESRQLLAWVDQGGGVRLTNAHRESWLAHEQPAVECLFSGDGRQLVTLDEIGVLRVWDVETRKLIGMTMDAPPGFLRSLAAVSNNGDRAAAVQARATESLDDCRALRWETNSQTAIQPLEQDDSSGSGPVHPSKPLIATGVSDISSFSPDGAVLAYVTSKRDTEGPLRSRLHILDTTSRQAAREPIRINDKEINAKITDLIFTKDSDRLVLVRHGSGNFSGGGPIHARLWDVNRGAPTGPLVVVQDASGAKALRPGGEEMAIGEDYPADDPQSEYEGQPVSFRIWNLLTGAPSQHEFTHDGAIVVLAFSPDGSLLASGSTGQTVRLWNPETGEQIGDPLLHDSVVTRLIFLGDGNRLLTVTGDGVWRTWQIPSGRPLLPPVRTAAEMAIASVSRDGARLVTAGMMPDNQTAVEEWDLATGRPLGPSRAATGGPESVCYDIGSQWIVLNGNSASIWPAAESLAGSASDILSWIECHTGVTMDELGALRSLDASEIEQRRPQWNSFEAANVSQRTPLEVWQVTTTPEPDFNDVPPPPVIETDQPVGPAPPAPVIDPP